MNKASHSRHARSQSNASNGSTSPLLSSPSSFPRDIEAEYGASTTPLHWTTRRLRCFLPFAGVFGILGVLVVASNISPPKSIQAMISHATMSHTSAEADPALNATNSTQTTQTQNATSSPFDPAVLANMSIEALYARQSQTLEQAIARYSLKNDRAPPPNFDKRFKFAQEKKCLIDDYDQIQRDFEPFYQLAKDDPAHFQRMIDLGRNLMLEDSKGLATIKIENGEVKMPAYAGTAFDYEWPGTLGRFSHILPNMDFMINGRDEPCVVFNVREPGVREDARNLTDLTPFHIAPIPTSEFFKQHNGCNSLNSDMGFSSSAIEDVAFLRSSSSSDFTTDLWPILSMTKISPCFSDILFPGQYYYETSGWSGKFAHPNNVSWDDKKSQLYWRGTSNGGHIIGENHHKFSRFRLVKIAQNHSDLLDAKMTGFFQWHCTFDCDREPIIKEYNIGGGSSPREEVYKYKYLLDVDGNTFSGRYLGLLRSGSLVFKSTAFEEYFNDWLRPYEHYIPVKPDLSDLVEKVEWAIAHDDEARLIQEVGTQFAQRVLTDAQNDCYFAAVLLEWARVQTNSAPQDLDM
ncbi:glycosyl transferase family 90-domain-containing protein [Mycena sp. CBHHK59/15]|nr:glycosyl transferase family 90-domain-containing protein [Mycena sp. CBHHK59/15]